MIIYYIQQAACDTSHFGRARGHIICYVPLGMYEPLPRQGYSPLGNPESTGRRSV